MRRKAGMHEDHAIALDGGESRGAQAIGNAIESRDAFAAVAVLPVMERAAETIADDAAAREVDALMPAMRGQRANDAVLAAAKENDRLIAEVEAPDFSAAQRRRSTGDVPGRDERGRVWR